MRLMHTMLQPILTQGLGKLTFIAAKSRLKNMLQCNGWSGAGHPSAKISAQTLLIFTMVKATLGVCASSKHSFLLSFNT